MGFFDGTADNPRPRWTDFIVAVLIFLAAVMVVAATIAPVQAAPSVASLNGALARYAPGTIVISQSERRLYLVLGADQALSYPVAVGRMGKQWQGLVHVDGKYRNPAWAPPAEVKRAEPWLPDYIPGGSPRNPMGMRALTLSGDQYAIHGTNRPDSIGKAASFGCIRMTNRDVVDLFDRVTIGTPVVMLR